MIKNNKKPLGMGLDALLGPEKAAFMNPTSAEVHMVETNRLYPGKYQPRSKFDEQKIDNLVQSIRSNGIIQPLVVRKIVNKEGYEIIAGERRWRAAKKIGLAQVPYIIKEISDKQALEIGLIENVQRDDLQPLEEAAGYKKLIEEFKYTQEQLAEIIGTSRPYIANLLRLLQLPDEVKRQLDDGNISVGHARCLVNVTDYEPVLQAIVNDSMNVRQTEQFIRSAHPKAHKVAKSKASPNTIVTSDTSFIKAADNGPMKDDDLLIIEQTLAQKFSLPVNIITDGTEGVIQIQYDCLDKLDELLKLVDRIGDAHN